MNIFKDKRVIIGTIGAIFTAIGTVCELVSGFIPYSTLPEHEHIPSRITEATDANSEQSN